MGGGGVGENNNSKPSKIQAVVFNLCFKKDKSKIQTRPNLSPAGSGSQHEILDFQDEKQHEILLMCLHIFSLFFHGYMIPLIFFL